MSKQVSEKHLEDIDKRVDFTATEMSKIQKRISDLNRILEDQKNLRSDHKLVESELNRLKHTALP